MFSTISHQGWENKYFSGDNVGIKFNYQPLSTPNPPVFPDHPFFQCERENKKMRRRGKKKKIKGQRVREGGRAERREVKRGKQNKKDKNPDFDRKDTKWFPSPLTAKLLKLLRRFFSRFWSLLGPQSFLCVLLPPTVFLTHLPFWAQR